MESKRLKTNLLMGLLLVGFLLSFSLSCFAQKNGDTYTVTIRNDSLNKKTNVKIPKEEAYQMNINFDDNPVWVWVKYDHNLRADSLLYNHIYGINYWDEQGSVKTLYYEQDRKTERKDSIDFSNYMLKPYSGDRTLQLIGKEADTLLLFNVLEDPKLSRVFKGVKYKRVPTVNYNHKREKVTDFDIEINIVPKDNFLCEVTIMNDDGINKYLYKSSCSLADDVRVSYYDMVDDTIYLLERDCYLKRIEN